MVPPLSRQRSHLSGAVLLGLWLLSGPPAALAQGTSPSAVAAEYMALVDRYAAGEDEAAAAALAEHDARWIETAVAAVERRTRAWPARRIQAAILLHTDAVVDGWVLQNRVGTNLAASRRLAAAAGDGKVPASWERDWLLVVNWYLLSELDLVAMPPWLDTAVARFGSDVRVQVTLGAFFEALGWDENLPSPLPWEARVLRGLGNRTSREALGEAAAAYRRALVIAPDWAPARVRLGRVLVRLRLLDDAARTVAPVHDHPGDRVWPYLSLLVAGAAETDRGRLDEAAAAYQRAAALLPSCQTPLVGLGAVRRLQGRLLESADIAQRLATPDGVCDDPWSFYRFGELPDVRARLLLELRRRVAAP